jgi:hypothetical protein
MAKVMEIPFRLRLVIRARRFQPGNIARTAAPHKRIGTVDSNGGRACLISIFTAMDWT